MQILILGMHRSGTSLVTRMVNMMGAYVGPEGSAFRFANENPKGFWERKDLVKHNIKLLELHGATWPDVANWPLPFRPKEHPLLDSMKTLIMNLDAFRPWVIKDPRLCLTLPYWRELLEVPVAVIVYRDPLEVAVSLNTRDLDQMSIERGIALWEFYAVALLNAAAGLPQVFVRHADFLHDPVNATKKFYNDLVAEGVQGLRLPSQREITAFIAPQLYRAKPPILELTTYQRELAAMLQGSNRPNHELEISEKSRNILRQPMPSRRGMTISALRKILKAT